MVTENQLLALMGDLESDRVERTRLARISDLTALIGRGEDSRTQFKRDVSNPESLAGDLAAFSKSRGGRILIGVTMDIGHFREFFEKQYGEPLEVVLEREGISLDRLLANLALARSGSLNLAGLMLFGRNPQRHRPVFAAKAVSFVGDDPAGTKYRDGEDIGGCLRDMFKGMRSFLTRNLRRIQGAKGINTEGDLELSPTALEELLVNMLLHRDYFISAPWRIFIFDNRIELISPGALPNTLTIENIRHGISVIRNPLIASFATKELPYRGIGTGIRRALAAVPALQLESDHERNLFTATIPRATMD